MHFQIRTYISIFIVFITTAILFALNTPICAKIITINNLKVTKVIDGDTIWVKDINNKTFKVRLLGINAPEICTQPPEPYSFQAKQQLEFLLTQQTIDIQYESENKKDKYNRIIAHIYRKKDNLWINLELIKLGLAYVYIINSNILDLESLIKAEDTAINNQSNIWNHSKYLPISPEKAVHFINEYKIVIGKINNVKETKNNFWLIFESTNPTLPTNNNTISKNIISNINNTKKTISSTITNNILSVKVSKNSKLHNSQNWNKYIGKIIKVRGYIEQSNKNYSPFIILKNINTIQIMCDK